MKIFQPRGQNPPQVLLAEDNEVVEHLLLRALLQTSAYGFRFRLRGEIGRNSSPSVSRIAQNSVVNFVSQSRMMCVGRFIHSEGDLRCNIEQADQLYTALKLLGVPTRFVRYPSSTSHGMSRNGPPDLRMHRLRQILAWWQQYLAPNGRAR